MNGPADNAFQEVLGLSVGPEIDESQEDEQPYRFRAPKATKHGNLVLRRGFVKANSPLAEWVEGTLNTDFTKPIQTHDIQLCLLNGQGTALATWHFREAWPVKWSMFDFKSQGSAFAIETLEFAYSAFQRLDN